MEILPQVLTRSVIASLIEDLDASDVLECYSLTRNAHLSGQFQNATIQKMALGLRYDPPSNSHKEALELTLEYGPQRIGADLEEESMPYAMRQNHLSWENEGKVYYTTTSIQEYRWKSAYYMASISGAVLEKILEKAVSYTTIKPRYQPFSVVSTDPETGVTRQMSKSSSSVDFVYEMWTDMAELGVDLRPILTPPSYIPRLHIAGKVEKVSGYDSEGKYIPQEAATFYKALANCWSAIATGDYSEYETSMPTSMPSIPPSLAPTYITPSATPSVYVTELPTAEATTSEPTQPVTESPTNLQAAGKDEENGDDEKDDEPNTKKVDTTGESDSSGEGDLEVDTTKDESEDSGESDANEEAEEEQQGDSAPKETDGEDPPDEDDDEDASADDDDTGSTGDGRMRRSLKHKMYAESLLPSRAEQAIENDTDDVFISELAHHNLTSLSPSSSHLLASNTTMAPSMAPTGDTTSESQKAANEAHEAAQQTKNATTHEEAEKAAETAEHAAQKAVNAAKWEKDMEDLLSGDGQLVTQAFAQCWTDPRYGIASENTSAIIGYMYYDGNFYYRLNLTLPYLDVVELQRAIPQQPAQSSTAVDDFVDWTLAFVIMGLSIFGMMLFVQQIGIRLLFYRRQKHFFNPTKHGAETDDEMDLTARDDDSFQNGRGQEHGFPADVIPLSMGGRKPTFRNSQLLVTNSPTTERRARATVEIEGDVEMTDMAMMPEFDDDDSAPTTQLPPLRFTRHPDLVDLPNLTSRSKVARPVTMNSLSSDPSLDTMERMHSL